MDNEFYCCSRIYLYCIKLDNRYTVAEKKNSTRGQFSRSYSSSTGEIKKYTHFIMSTSKQPLTFVLDLGQPPGQDIKIPVTFDQHSSAATSPVLRIKGAISEKQTGHAGTHSSDGRGGGSDGRGRGGDLDCSGRNDHSNSNNNNNHRGNRSGGNVRKVSVYESLLNQHSEVFDATGLSKGEIIRRMKKGNVGASQLEQFVSDLFRDVDQLQEEEKKKQEESKSWSLVSKKSVRRTSAQQQQDTGIPEHDGSTQHGRVAMRGDREDRERQCILRDLNVDSEKRLNSIKKDGNFLRDESSHKASPGDGASKEECGKEEGEKKRVSIIYFL